jgi:hypothetical protein
LKELAPDGLLAIHISNRYLDLIPVLWEHAKCFDLEMVFINTDADESVTTASQWVLLSSDPSLLNVPAIISRATDFSSHTRQIRQWTDDFSNLFQILK